MMIESLLLGVKARTPKFTVRALKYREGPGRKFYVMAIEFAIASGGVESIALLVVPPNYPGAQPILSVFPPSKSGFCVSGSAGETPLPPGSFLVRPWEAGRWAIERNPRAIVDSFVESLRNRPVFAAGRSQATRFPEYWDPRLNLTCPNPPLIRRDTSPRPPAPAVKVAREVLEIFRENLRVDLEIIANDLPALVERSALLRRSETKIRAEPPRISREISLTLAATSKIEDLTRRSQTINPNQSIRNEARLKALSYTAFCLEDLAVKGNLPVVETSRRLEEIWTQQFDACLVIKHPEE